MITVGLPAYRAKEIAWLALEGLCRQKTREKWELIVVEEVGGMGEETLQRYYKDLQSAGCVSVAYTALKKWVPLAQKWCLIISEAQGDIFVMQAADDYPHPDRLQMSADLIDGMYCETKGYFFDIPDQKGALYDKDLRFGYHPTGLNMAYKTALLKDIQPEFVRSGVDSWLYYQVYDRFGEVRAYVERSDTCLRGVFTQGQNNISMSRLDCFYKPNAVFKSVDLNLYDILPDYVAGRLLSMKYTERMTKIAGKYED